MSTDDTPTALPTAVVEWERLGSPMRPVPAPARIACRTADDLEAGIREFVAPNLRSPRFEIAIAAPADDDPEPGDIVLISSGTPGFPAGDFGRGRIVRWEMP